MNSYKYVAVIGIDGMGKFNSQTDTPNLDKIFEKGDTCSALSFALKLRPNGIKGGKMF